MKKIVNKFEESPFYNWSKKFYNSTSSKLELDGINIYRARITGQKDIYDPENSEHQCKIISNLSDEQVNDLKTKKAFLLLDSSTEGMRFNKKTWQIFHNNLNRLSIPTEYIVFLTQNIIFEYNYTNWIEQSKTLYSQNQYSEDILY